MITVTREHVEKLLREANDPRPSNRRTLARVELIGIKIATERDQ